jgi:hypothetical protein
MKTYKHISLVALLISICLIAIFRLTNVVQYELSWDVLGYYIYLPATFVHHDPMLNDITWLKDLNANGKLAGTLYMISQNKEGHTMYFFLMGMALFYLPFFFLAMAYAKIAGFPVDGFSMPFQYFLVIGGVIYTIIGLIFLRKILKRYFNDNIVAIVLLIIVFSTNYIHHLTLKNLETVNVLFMLITLIVWNTIKWHETYKLKHMVIAGVSVTMMALVKPTEVIAIMIPLLWNVTSPKHLIDKAKLLFSKNKQLLITAAICFILVLPQILYWHHLTGKFIYDSYINPGVGLDFTRPHTWHVLFSFRKGWLVYTPVMIFALAGFYFMYKQNRGIFFASFGYFIISFYILSSWTEWWYGAAYSCRPVITSYPMLALALASFIAFIHKKRKIVIAGFYILVIFFTFLNQFQWWQMRHYILDPYRTTKKYYEATFLSTKIPPDAEDLKLVVRSADGNNVMKDLYKYQKTLLLSEDFSSPDFKGNIAENLNDFYRITDQEFFPILELPYKEITSKDHFWVKVIVDVRFPDSISSNLPGIVTTLERKIWSYNYWATDIKPDSIANQWHTVSSWYLAADVRERSDIFKCYIWKRSKEPMDIDNLKIELYRTKRDD